MSLLCNFPHPLLLWQEKIDTDVYTTLGNPWEAVCAVTTDNWQCCNCTLRVASREYIEKWEHFREVTLVGLQSQCWKKYFTQTKLGGKTWRTRDKTWIWSVWLWYLTNQNWQFSSIIVWQLNRYLYCKRILMWSLITEGRVWWSDQAPVLPLLTLVGQRSHHRAGGCPNRVTSGGCVSCCLHDNVLHQQNQIPEVLEKCSSPFWQESWGPDRHDSFLWRGRQEVSHYESSR